MLAEFSRQWNIQCKSCTPYSCSFDRLPGLVPNPTINPGPKKKASAWARLWVNNYILFYDITEFLTSDPNMPPWKSDMDGCSEFRKTCLSVMLSRSRAMSQRKKSEFMNLLFIHLLYHVLVLHTLEEQKERVLRESGSGWSCLVSIHRFSPKSTWPDLLVVIRPFNGFVWMIAVCVSTRLVTYCEGLAHCEAGTGCNGVDIFRNVSKDAWFLAKPQLANTGLAWTTGYFVYSISICNCILLCSITIQYLQSSLVICNSALFCLMPQHSDACCCVVSVSLSSIQHTSELSRLQHPQINISVTKFLRFSALRGYCFRWKRSPISCCPVLSLSRSCQPVKSAGPMCRRICEKKTIIYGKVYVYIYIRILKKHIKVLL